MNALCPDCMFHDVAIHDDEVVAFCNHRIDGFPNIKQCTKHVQDWLDTSETAQDRIDRRLEQIRKS